MKTLCRNSLCALLLVPGAQFLSPAQVEARPHARITVVYRHPRVAVRLSPARHVLRHRHPRWFTHRHYRYDGWKRWHGRWHRRYF